MFAYIGIEGYNIPSGFIVKELAIVYPNEEFDHYLFKSPNDFLLTAKDEETIRYITRHLNNLSYTDGDIPYSMVGSVLEKLKDYTIYTYGLQTQRLVQGFLPTATIINTQDDGHKLDQHLPDPSCFRIHNFRYCAKSKAIEIQKFVEKRELCMYE